MIDYSVVVNVIGMIALPVAGWAFGQGAARNKVIGDKDKEIIRIREQRDKFDDEKNKEEHEVIQKVCAGLKSEMERMAKTAYDTRIEIAQQYATMVALRETEKRFFEGLTRLENKLDRVLEGKQHG